MPPDVRFISEPTRFHHEDDLTRTALIVGSRFFREAIMKVLDGPGTTFAEGMNTVTDAVALMEDGVLPDLVIAVLIGGHALDEAMNAIPLARKRFPATRWLLLAESISPKRLRQAMTVGVDGFLLLEITIRVLRHATELLLLGQTLLPRGLAEPGEPSLLSAPVDNFVEPAWKCDGESNERRPVAEVVPTASDNFALPVLLSERERQILNRLARGYSNKVIARELEIADATVKVHVKALLRKLRVTNRTQAAILAVKYREAQSPSDLPGIIGVEPVLAVRSRG